MGSPYSLRVITKLYVYQSIATPYAAMGMKVRGGLPRRVVIASDQRERGNLTVVVLKDCGIASASPRNDMGDFRSNDMVVIGRRTA